MIARWAALLLAALPYLAYLVYACQASHGPVDFETFRDIGGRLLSGREIYVSNSYYPMPYVLVFGLLACLPRSLALVLWSGLPVLAAALIGGPWALAFAPVFGHFAGGQTAVFGMIGLWGFRKYQDRAAGGAWLALTLLKPQLGVFLVLWACVRWAVQLWKERRVARQAWVFAGCLAGLYLPAFGVRPGWVGEWLSQPRPFFERALAGMAPRLLVNCPDYIILISIIAIIYLVLGWDGQLDHFVLLSALVNPLLHDYDLITLIPVIQGWRMKLAAAALSLPGWWVIVRYYDNNLAWAVFALIAPGLLILSLRSGKDVVQNA